VTKIKVGRGEKETTTKEISSKHRIEDFEDEL